MSGSSTLTKCSRVAGSITIGTPLAALRTTCRWTWLVAGTSITTSPCTVAWQPSRRPGASPRISS